MMAAILFGMLVVSVAAALADVTNTNLAIGACLCSTAPTGLNIRTSPCRSVVGIAKMGTCFTYLGSNRKCSLTNNDEGLLKFFKIRYQSVVAWAAGKYLNVEPASSCSGIVNTNPVNGTCMCSAVSDLNLRTTACGTVIGSANTGNCFTYLGSKQTCTLSGVSYEFFKFRYGSGEAWAAGTYFNEGSASQCSGNIQGGGSGAFTQKCMKCICQIESNCNANIGCNMDVGSLSCGAYQIKEPYWIDCGRPGSDWKSCANELGCAETCVKAYMNRYGTYCTDGRASVCEDYARIHNGGPNGCQSIATVGYWDKVRACCGGQSGCD